MIGLRMLRSSFLWSALLLFVSSIPAQQGGQPGSGGGSTGGKTGGTTGGTTGSGGDKGTTDTRTPTSRTVTQTQPNAGSSSARQERQPMPFISGVVVMEDGTPVPMGVVIERVCSGNKTKESHVGSNGQFSFQVGSNTAMMMDASDSGWGEFASPGVPGMRSPEISSVFGMRGSSDLNGCELKADLPGYRSSAVILTGSQFMGRVVDVGTIVLHPVARVPGTTVRATSLQAPKDARKAMERGVKELRKEKLEEAEENLQTAVGIYPAYAAAWLTLGQIYRQQQRTEDARLAFSKALEADGNYVTPYVELARIAVAEKKWEEVASLTDRALALDPLDIPDGFLLNSLAYYNLKNMDAAERSARKAQRLDSLHRLPLGYLILASVLQHKQDSAGEAEQLRYYLKYAPQASNAGQIRVRLQELERANGAVADTKRPEQ